MAVDMFLKLDGIKGESKDAKHKDEIHIESFSWGMSQTGTMSYGGGGGAGKVSVNDMSFMKPVDKASCALMLACAAGTHIKEALLTVRKAGDKPLDFLTVKMTDILVSSLQHSGASEIPTESLSINFAKFQVEYFEQKPDGSGAKAGNMGWDLKQNIKL